MESEEQQREEAQYTDIRFNFGGTDEVDAWALGNAVVRAAGAEMVLELSEDDDEPPFCRVIGKRDGLKFEGTNAIRRKGIPHIDARWTMDGLKGEGTWIEDGRKYPFSFTLPG